jgi:aryl carrier-like protein
VDEVIDAMACPFQNHRQLLLIFCGLDAFQSWNSLDELLERHVKVSWRLRIRILTSIRCVAIVHRWIL